MCLIRVEAKLYRAVALQELSLTPLQYRLLNYGVESCTSWFCWIPGLLLPAAFLKQPSLMWTRNFGALWWSTRLQIESSSMWGRMIFGKGSQKCLSKISVNSLKHFKDLKFSRSSVDHSQQGELTCFHGCLGWIHGYKEPAVQKESTSSTTSIFSGATDNCLNWMASTQTNLVQEC